MDAEKELLTKIVSAMEKADFFRSTLLSDSFNDWNLVKDLGEFLVRTEPDSEIMGHALLARAHRHLGNRQLALNELKQCETLTHARELKPWEVETLLPLLKKEERLLSDGTSGSESHKT